MDYLEYDERLYEYERDEDYYFSDGSCLFLIEDRMLFRIHRSRIEDDSTVLRDMLPPPLSEWKSRKYPPPAGEVVLDDTVREFRALCWALYAKPNEIFAQTNPVTFKFVRMINVLAMAQKYRFTDLRDWALSTLDSHLRNPQFQCHNWAAVGRLLKLAYCNRKNDLAIRIEQRWLYSIMTSPDEGNCFVKALETAEDLKIRHFHGKVYHCYLKAIGKFDPPFESESPNDGTPLQIGDYTSFVEEDLTFDLDDTQKLQLYYGYSSLIQLRNNLNKALPLRVNPRCSNHDTCQRGWKMWWSNFLMDTSTDEGEGLYDPADFLQELESRIMTSPILIPAGTGEVFCQSLIKAQVCETKKYFHDTLADYFRIPARRQE